MQPVVIRTTNIQETIAPDDGDDLACKIMSMSADELAMFIFLAKTVLGLRFD